ncbi:undecaprenyl pyrophosphate phosphatase [compost metagenome]
MQFHSMFSISALTVVVTLVLIGIGTLSNPWRPIVSFVKELIHSKVFLIMFLSMIGVLLLNSLELKFEESISYNADFTPWLFSLEGKFVATFQSWFHSDWITTISSFFYLVVFQALILSSLIIFAGERRLQFLKATCCAVMINYLIAIPFYLLIPVNEVWSFAPSGASLYMLEAFPEFNTLYRPLSGINNCFPSLHTSISVTVAILAVRSGNRIWAAIAVSSAAIIVFSIFYLGIHWLIDMLGGLILAGVASSLGLKWANRFQDRIDIPRDIQA